MSQGMLKNVYKAFNRSASKIYLRTSEINQIKSFLKNKNNILHICGNPGTGKTVTIKHVLKNTKHTFYNFLENENINYQQAKHKIIVIDEFDKFYSQKPLECKKLFLFVSQKNKKLITISNSLNIFEDILYFNSYSTDDLIYIIKSKLEELKGIAMDDQVLKYIIVKMGKGDLRRIFDSCKCAIEQCLENRRLTVEMADVVNNKENCEENGLNHKIVKEIVSSGCKGDKKSVYEKYAAICKESNVPPLSRTDFFLLYDMYKEM